MRLIPLLLFLTTTTLAQATWQGHLGATLLFGRPSTSIGWVASLGYHLPQGEVRLTQSMGYRARALGPKGTSWQVQHTLGVFGGSPEKNMHDLPAFEPMLPSQNRHWWAGYGLSHYWDNRHTSQWTGHLILGAKALYVWTENDALALIGSNDRYRTGALSVGYRSAEWAASAQIITWTGATKCGAERCYSDNYPCRWGYRDLSACPYGRYSHGIAQIRAHKSLPYGQIASVATGIDSEKVRHLFQNKIMHDMIWLPKKWVPAPNPHFPMLQENGLPYTEEEGTSVRKAKWVWQWGLNPSGHY